MLPPALPVAGPGPGVLPNYKQIPPETGQSYLASAYSHFPDLINSTCILLAFSFGLSVLIPPIAAFSARFNSSVISWGSNLFLLSPWGLMEWAGGAGYIGDTSAQLPKCLLPMFHVAIKDRRGQNRALLIPLSQRTQRRTGVSKHHLLGPVQNERAEPEQKLQEDTMVNIVYLKLQRDQGASTGMHSSSLNLSSGH